LVLPTYVFQFINPILSCPSIFVTEEVYKQLTEMKAELGLSYSGLIKELIENYELANL